ncbi:MAG: metal-sensing transcriptional repressor [Bacilli bacterium]|jgi:DNA-binding FrmR family transcriptional regulator|nr:metal-sensing transcriptional repressor [Bacilli bacterium]
MLANHKSVKRKLNIIKGQIEGLIRMVDEDRYCIDISDQVLASIGLLKSVNSEVLNAHLEGCVKNALNSQNEEQIKEKINEISATINKLLK